MRQAELLEEAELVGLSPVLQHPATCDAATKSRAGKVAHTSSRCSNPLDAGQLLWVRHDVNSPNDAVGHVEHESRDPG